MSGPAALRGALLELAVRDLGVVEAASLLLGEGMTALTGETGAGKTLLVEAIELLTGARADSSLVRAGADEAVIEGRFLVDDTEVVARRVIPRAGRSRAYLAGRLCSAQELAAWATGLVDLHGQHEHQSLLGVAAQRAALDAFAGVDTETLRAARQRVRGLEAQLADLGGDARARQRTVDLLRFQIGEIEAAALEGPDEDAALDALEDALGDALAHREAAAAALRSLRDGDENADDGLGAAIAALRGRGPFEAPVRRLEALRAELDDVVADVRAAADAVREDPERLQEVRERRQLLRDLQRKYGDGLVAVLASLEAARAELAELEGHEATVARTEAELAAAVAERDAVEAQVGEQRRAAAPTLAAAVTARLADLAMAGARIEVQVGDGAGDDVAILLAANSGQAAGPLARVASGGELARTMLALRLELVAGPPVLVFDEVDAGVGGQAARAVGAALASVAEGHQVLVVTHLPQVAAAAGAQLLVEKHDDGAATHTTVRALSEEERVVEVSRMLAGAPDSDAARQHARELLGHGAASRARS